ncbi:hypothetical protein BOX15_Mlig001462g1, partial [Macrostomum lignano]
QTLDDDDLVPAPLMPRRRAFPAAADANSDDKAANDLADGGGPRSAAAAAASNWLSNNDPQFAAVGPGGGGRPAAQRKKAAAATATAAVGQNCQQQQQQQESSQFVYNMRHPCRGYCLIVNNYEFDASTKMSARSGTASDLAVLRESFRRLQFQLVIVENVRCGQLLSLCSQLAAQDHSQADCFAAVLMSHGEPDQIYGTDGLLRVDEILARFRGDVCPGLAGKPKLFFLQACRGSKFDAGVEVPDSGAPSDEADAAAIEQQQRRLLPSEADFLVAYSVTPGYYSWRNAVHGSWFVQSLCRGLDEWGYGGRLDLQRLLTRVCWRVANLYESNARDPLLCRKKQVPCIVSMLTKEVYFVPK